MAESVPGAAGLNAPVSCLLAAACLISFLSMLWLMCGTKRYGHVSLLSIGQGRPARRRFWYIFLGMDDRVSTSGVAFALWTLALAYALLVIALHGALYRSEPFYMRYLLVLGIPAATAISAKAITRRQVSDGAVSKKSSQYKKKTLASAFKEIVSNDQGNLDLGDAQYFIVTLGLLAVFFTAFFRDPVRLPALPDWLIGITAASAIAYIGKKTSSAARVMITAVSPQKGSRTATIKIFGSGLGETMSGDRGVPYVTFGGLAASVQDDWTDTLIRVTLPPSLSPGIVDVQVTTSSGRTVMMPAAFELTL